MGLALCAYSLGNHRGPVFQRTPPLVWCSTIIILKFLIILNKGLHIFCSHQPCKFCRHPDYLQNENGNPASLISMKWPVLKTHQGTWHTELRVTILNLSHRTTKTNILVGPRLYFVRKTDGRREKRRKRPWLWLLSWTLLFSYRNEDIPLGTQII